MTLVYLRIALIYCLLTLPAHAQMETTQYYEIPLEAFDKDDVEFKAFPMHEQGVLLLRQEAGVLGKTFNVEFIHLDTAMQVKFAQKATLSSTFSKHVVWQSDERQNVYGLAQEVDYSKKFHFLHLDLATQTSKVFQAEFPFTLEIQHFQVSQQMVYIAGISNYRWVALTFNLLDNSIKLLPQFFEDREEIKQIHADTTRNELLFVIANTDHRKRKLYVQPYSSLIGKGNRLELQGRTREVRKRSFLEAIAFHPLPNSPDIWTVGAYSFDGQPFWQGLFVTTFEGQEQKSLTFYRFQDFANFFKHLPPRRRQKLEDKMQQYNENDREYTFGRRMLWQSKWIDTPHTRMLMFVGYHQQHPNNTTTWQQANTPFRTPNPYYQMRLPAQTNLVYTYDYAALVGFDKQSGRLLWDNMMKLEEIEHQYLQNVVETGFIGDSIITAYMKDEKLYSQICFKRNIPQAPHMQEVKATLTDRLVDKTEDAEIKTWYGQYFLLTGNVKHLQTDAKLASRYGFYCAKLRYIPKKEAEKAKN